jgi:cyclic beta-1,2-glucan synthetase
MTVFVPVADPVKIVILKVTNHSRIVRMLSATYYAEWVLGTTRDHTAPFVVTEVDPKSGALLARCALDPDFGGAIAFADISLRPRTVTGNRHEFLGRNRSPARPVALDRVGLSGDVGPGLDPCAAIHGRFQVGPGETGTVVFVLGQAPDLVAAGGLAVHYRNPATATAALADVTSAWDRRLLTIQVKTPDKAFDILANRWLLYQVMGCRLWGRSAFYQSGGAYGFRDQLQDVMALLVAEPGEARAHLLRAASRQFQEGDVQHWWHPPSGRGVRTRFSDDFLWLSYAVARYTEVTGDTSILEEPVGYVRGGDLGPGEQEKYFLPTISDQIDTLYSHCLRALERGWALGPHGLPLMGCGDWNDGMNLVGVEGKGESVWVGWFQVLVRTRFAAVATARGDTPTATALQTQATELRSAIEAHGWDGEWYLRAWFDDGTPLGSHNNDECQIDSLTQSWAVLSGPGDMQRAKLGVDAAILHLVDRENRLVKLFSPAFDKGRLHPGYIKGYVPGIRENGGQYTHAAVWLVQALAGLGRGTEAFALWQLLNPITHTDTPAGVTRYRVEPYVVAADVYGLPPHTGRGGWTWYTGSAAWLYRAAIETILGFTLRGDHLTFDPCIPAIWREFDLEYRYHSTIYQCRIENPLGVEKGVAQVWLDGQPQPSQVILLSDDAKTHAVRVLLGPPM